MYKTLLKYLGEPAFMPSAYLSLRNAPRLSLREMQVLHAKPVAQSAAFARRVWRRT